MRRPMDKKGFVFVHSIRCIFNVEYVNSDVPSPIQGNLHVKILNNPLSCFLFNLFLLSQSDNQFQFIYFCKYCHKKCISHILLYYNKPGQTDLLMNKLQVTECVGNFSLILEMNKAYLRPGRYIQEFITKMLEFECTAYQQVK